MLKTGHRAVYTYFSWYFLALCYSVAGQLDTAISMLNKNAVTFESEHEPHVPSLLLGAKLCFLDQIYSLG